MRIGIGYDVHEFSEECVLVLGGVTIPYERGLEGYSDADVLTHAVMDALIGACGQGDIGKLFPDTDPEYKGISSLKLLEQVTIMLKTQHYEVENIDAVVIAQEPKLAPYTQMMQENLAAALGIGEDRINVKATTTEHLGFIGRKEGMAAQAVALLKRDTDRNENNER